MREPSGVPIATASTCSYMFPSLFHIFYHILAFAILSIITCFFNIFMLTWKFYSLENDLGEIETL